MRSRQVHIKGMVSDNSYSKQDSITDNEINSMRQPALPHSEAACAVHTNQLWSGKEPELTKLVSPNRKKER